MKLQIKALILLYTTYLIKNSLLHELLLSIKSLSIKVSFLPKIICMYYFATSWLYSLYYYIFQTNQTIQEFLFSYSVSLSVFQSFLN